MSKPVTNVEIEDVLSSIRRLVSTSSRIERSEVEPAEEVSDKLVLTPSLRVDDGADEEASEAEISFEDQSSEEVEETAGMSGEGADSDTAEDAEMASDEAFLEKIAESAATDDATDAEAEGSGDIEVAEEQESADELAEILAETADNSTEIDEILSDAQDEAEAGESPSELLILGDGESESEAAAADEDDTEPNLQRRAAEFEEIIATTDDAWDPDGTTEDENAASPVGPVPWQNDGEDADTADAPGDEIDGVFQFTESDLADDDTREADAEADDPAEESEEGAEDVAADAPQEEIEAKDNDLARVMAGVARECAEEEEDSDDDTDVEEEVLDLDPAPFVFRSQSSSRPFDDDTLTPDPVTDDQREAAVLAVEEALLDEEALRDMVSDIVRQELQGALGERITRNVRKLVRREIHRALASQELE